MSGLEVMRALFFALVVWGFFWALAKSVSVSLSGWVARLAEKTETSWDDRVVAAMKIPAYYVVFILGGYLAVQGLPFGGLLRDVLAGVLFVIFTMAGCFLASTVLKETLHWLKDHAQGDSHSETLPEYFSLLEFLLNTIIALSGASFALHHFGWSLPILSILLFIVALLLGWAMKDPATNMAAGFLLALQRSLLPGDDIELPGGLRGTVERIGLLGTILRMESGRAIIPNSKLLSEPLQRHNRKQSI